MEYKLLKLTVCGIKNIESPITLDLYDHTDYNHIDFEGNNIRAIYGSNGSGKSALISSVNEARLFMTQANYLSSKTPDYFDNLINKKTHSFHFGWTFATLEGKGPKTRATYEYGLDVKKSEFGSYVIANEKLAQIEGNIARGERRVLFETKQGEIVDLFIEEEEEKVGNFLRKKTQNLLTKQTLISMIPGLLAEYSSHPGSFIGGSLMEGVMNTLVLALTLGVFLDQSDLHESAPSFLKWSSKKWTERSGEELKELLIEQFASPKKGPETVIPYDQFEAYRERIDRLTSFLQLFKPELQKIDIDKKDNGSAFLCTNTLRYRDYSVSEEYESTGIKKLISLFRLFQELDHGGIVFIDELDANISGVYLEKFIEYVSKYAKGQLVFTAHSMDPMKYLYQESKSIYFLGEQNVFVPWIKDGNYRPYTLYPEGMIEGSPFNVEPFDFLHVFGEKK
jgi:energy-coupling factor transporter ATP-binding protein EcfA2